MSLDRLEATHLDHRFRIQVGDRVIEMRSPTSLSLQEIHAAYATEGATLLDPEERGITFAGARAGFYAWLDHFDMPEESELRRMLWMLDRYTDQIEVDFLLAGLDLQELWRSRRLRRLLLLLDALPLASLTKEALHTDPEYGAIVAREVAARRARGEADPPATPQLRDWTPQVEASVRLIDAVKMLNRTLIAVNTERGKNSPDFKPEPRPETAYKSERDQERRRKAEWLADRLTRAGTPPSDAD